MITAADLTERINQYDNDYEKQLWEDGHYDDFKPFWDRIEDEREIRVPDVGLLTFVERWSGGVVVKVGTQYFLSYDNEDVRHVFPTSKTIAVWEEV